MPSRATAARRPDAPFLLAPASAGLPYAPQGFRIEYGAFKTEVDRLRAGIRGRRLWPRGAGCLAAENRPVFFLHWLALNALGVSIVPINPDVRPDELSFQLELFAGRPAGGRIGSHAGDQGAALGRARLIDTDSHIPPCQTNVVAQHAEFNG